MKKGRERRILLLHNLEAASPEDRSTLRVRSSGSACWLIDGIIRVLEGRPYNSQQNTTDMFFFIIIFFRYAASFILEGKLGLTDQYPFHPKRNDLQAVTQLVGGQNITEHPTKPDYGYHQKMQLSDAMDNHRSCPPNNGNGYEQGKGYRNRAGG